MFLLLLCQEYSDQTAGSGPLQFNMARVFTNNNILCYIFHLVNFLIWGPKVKISVYCVSVYYSVYLCIILCICVCFCVSVCCLCKIVTSAYVVVRILLIAPTDFWRNSTPLSFTKHFHSSTQEHCYNIFRSASSSLTRVSEIYKNRR